MPNVTVLYSTNEPLGNEVGTAKQDLGQFRQFATLGGWGFLVIGILCMAAKFLPTLGSPSGMNLLFVIGVAWVLGSAFLFTMTRSAKPLFLSVYENGVALRGSDNVENYSGAHFNFGAGNGVRNAQITEARFLWSDVIAFHAIDTTPLLGSKYADHGAFIMGGRAKSTLADTGGIHEFWFLLRPQNGASKPVEVEWMTATVHKNDTVSVAPLLKEKLGTLPSVSPANSSANSSAV